ncbi:hypothetical protein C0993_001274, partial [Termitomyces sp. T159_Od127]
MLEIAPEDQETHEDDEVIPNEETQPLRIVVCMSPAASHRLLSAQYLQCDIGFKRVMGFQEFELVAMDATSNT